MGVRVGGGYADFELRLNNLRSGVKTAQEQIKLLRRDAAEPIIARFEFAGSAGRAPTGAGAAATAETAQIERARVQSEARVEATRIAAAQRFVAAETQAQAKITTARITSDAQAEAKIEVARIQSANRLATADQQARAKADAVLLANAARQETIRQQGATRTAAAQLAVDGRIAIARTSAETKIEATRITAAQRAAAADTAASAKTESARLAAEARIEAARIAAAQRDEALEKRLAAQKAGSGFALPRTFAGFTAAGVTQLAGAAGLLGLGQQIAGGLVGATREAVGLNSRLETATATLGSFTGSAQRTREVLAAIDREAAQVPIFDPGQLRSAAQALVLYTKGADDLSKKLRTAELLAVLNPDEGQGGGLGGAAFALREALSGDFTSLAERFNLPRSTINTLKEGKKTSEEFYQVVVQALSQMGVNDSLIQAQTQTTTGRMAALRSEFRQLLQEAGKPIFAQIGDSLSRLSALVQANQGDLRRFAQTVGQGLATGLRVATTAVEALVGAWTALGPTGQRVVVALAGAYAASKLAESGFGLLGRGASAVDGALSGAISGVLKGDFTVRQLTRGLSGAITAQGGLNQALGAMLGPAGAAQAAILLIAGAWTYGQAQIDAYVAKQKQAITITTGAQAQINAARQNDPNNSLLGSLLSQQEAELKRLENQKNIILDQVRATQGSFTQGKGLRGSLETIYTGTVAGLGKSAEAVAGLFGNDQYVSAWTRAADSMLNTGNASQQATSEINALQAQVRATQEQLSAALPFLNQYGAGIGTISAKYQQGQINAAQFATSMRQLTGIKAADTFGIVQGLSQLPGPERLQKLEVVFRDLLRQMNENPALAQNFLPQLQAIGAEIGRLKAQGPIIISIEMRRQLTGAAIEGFKAISERAKQTQSELTQLDTQYAQQQSERTAQAAKAWQGYLQQAGRAQRDFAIQQGRAQRDFYQGEQRAAADHTRRLVEIQNKLAADLTQIERDKQRKLRDLQREFDVDQSRKQEDFQEERQKLLAEGRIAEARELERKFNKDQRRAQEDLSRKKSETTDDAGNKGNETRADAAKQIADEKEQFAQQRLERLRAFAQQQADARAAFAQQQADARAAAVAQQADYKTQAAAEETAYKAHRQSLIDGLTAFVTEQQAKLNQSKKDMLAISALIEGKLTEDQARLKVGLDNAKKEWLSTMTSLKDEMGPAGYRAMVAWQQGAAAALTAGIPQIDQSLRPMRDRLVPQSPLRAGPLKNHERGAAKAAQMYIQGFASGLDASALDPQLEQFRRRLAQPADPTNMLRRDRQAAATGQAGQAGQQRVELQIALPSIVMDGRTVGQIVGPHVGEMIAGQMAIQVQVVDASTTGASQQSYRQIT